MWVLKVSCNGKGVRGVGAEWSVIRSHIRVETCDNSQLGSLIYSLGVTI